MNVSGLAGGKVRRGKYAPNADGIEEFVRIGRYGDQYQLNLFPGKHVLADEGSAFVATNPTPGTALAFAVNATYDVTKSFMVVKNLASPGDGKRVYLDSIKIMPTVAPASATALCYAIWLGTFAGYTSGGTEIIPVNTNGDDGTSPASRVIMASGTAVLTTVAAGLNRLVARGVARSVIPAVCDEICIAFGADSVGSSSSTASGHSVSNAPAIVIPPQGIAVLNIWMPSNAVTGLSYEAEVSLFER